MVNKVTGFGANYAPSLDLPKQDVRKKFYMQLQMRAAIYSFIRMNHCT
jgi:hypothetical protein